MPQKPAKFGIKYWLLCEVKISYVLRAIPYGDKKDRPEIGVAEHVVMSLMEPYHNTRQNVTTDNYFTSLKTANNLLQHNITMVGTLRRTRGRYRSSCMPTQSSSSCIHHNSFSQQMVLLFFATV